MSKTLKSSILDKLRVFPRFRELALVVFIFAVLFSHFTSGFPLFGQDLTTIVSMFVKAPGLSTAERLRYKIGPDFYDWTKLVRQNTSIGSYIMHPPQMWPWGMSGNPEFSQYFIYPAKLIREDRQQLFDPKSKITHVMIAWGEAGEEGWKGWPQFPVFAKKVYFMPQNRKVEVRGLDKLEPWISHAEKTVNFAGGKKWDLIYTSSEYDYWIQPASTSLSIGVKPEAEVKSNWPNSTALIARVDFGAGKSAVFSSAPNEKIGVWTKLVIEDLYSRASQFALLQGWGLGEMRVSGIGIDTGHPAAMFYQERYGLIEVEKGGDDRKKWLGQQVPNLPSLLAAGNIGVLEKDLEEARVFYQKSVLLEPSNPWPHWGLAEIANKKGDFTLAEREYRRASELAPKVSWFLYALGEFYQQRGELSRAEAEYQKSLDLYQGAFWTLRALGEINEAEGKFDIAYRYYQKASHDGGRTFTYDGKLAWEKAQEIKDEQQKIIDEQEKQVAQLKENLQETLARIEKDPKDWQSILTLAKAYSILGQTEKAKEYFRIAFKLNPRMQGMDPLPPIITNQLGQLSFGKEGPGVEFHLVDGKRIVELDNYHSYFFLSPDFFPLESGTIEVDWKPPLDILKEKGDIRNILYQHRGLYVYAKDGKFYMAVVKLGGEEWVSISSPVLSLDTSRWYKLGISYGEQGTFLYLDGREIASGDIKSGLSEEAEMYLGRGPLRSVSEKVSSGFFDTMKIYDYQKFKWD